MTKKFLVILAFFISISFGFWFFISQRRQSVSADPLSFIPVSAEPKKRFFDMTRTPDDINGYPESVYSLLHMATDDDLLGISCSDTFIRNWESLFFVRNQSNLKYTISLPHDTMIHWLTPLELSLPDAFSKEKKFLLGRLCLTSGGMTIFEYHRGVQQQFFDDYVTLGNAINSYLFISNDGKPLHAIDLTGADRGPIFHCMPMQMTKTGLLYYQCTEIQHGDATTWFYEVNLAKGESKELDACRYRYAGKPTRECDR